MSRILHAPYPIRRPYTALFMSLREATNQVIKEMEQGATKELPASDQQWDAEEAETHEPFITVRID